MRPWERVVPGNGAGSGTIATQLQAMATATNIQWLDKWGRYAARQALGEDRVKLARRILKEWKLDGWSQPSSKLPEPSAGFAPLTPLTPLNQPPNQHYQAIPMAKAM